MRLQFNELKATQAASRFLALGRGKMLYIKLLKLLYLLDRAALWKWGRPVTTGRYENMEHGPVVMNVYELITGPPDPGGIWHGHISRTGYWVRLLKDAGITELSRAEDALLVAIFKKFGAKNRREIIYYCHHHLPEWKDPGKGRKTPLEVTDILKAGNKPDSEIEEILSELESLAIVERMIS